MLDKPSFNIIFDLHDVIFDFHDEYRGTEKQFSVIPGMPPLLHQLHTQTDAYGKPRHRLFVLSNSPADSYHNYITYHSPIFSYFDGIVMSALSGFKKPDSQAYLYLLEKYNLPPATCIFIDDKEENVATARTLGMAGIVCRGPEPLLYDLKKHSVF
jgi:putative hydrolase of the HAD superfamily